MKVYSKRGKFCVYETSSIGGGVAQRIERFRGLKEVFMLLSIFWDEKRTSESRFRTGLLGQAVGTPR